METTTTNPQETVNEIYKYAADLLLEEKKTDFEVRQSLVERGLPQDAADVIVDNLMAQINSESKEQAKKDVLYGALWCFGGIAATVADIGFIFWGAIIFGGIQLVKGLMNL